MIALYSFAIAVLGALLSHWSHAGIEAGDADRRAKFRPVAYVLALLGAIGMVASAATAAAGNYP